MFRDLFGRKARSASIANCSGLIDFAECLVDIWGHDYIQEADLILPTDTYYPVSQADPEEMVKQIFALTVEHAGLEDWPLRLIREEKFSALQQLKQNPAQGTGSGAVASGLQFDDSTTPATGLITYVQDDLNSPDGFIYHCAQQLAAAMVWECEDIPGGDEAFWPMVDMAVCLMGFGVFACNASFHFEGFSDGIYEGYTCQQRGNLGTEQMAAALAIFVLICGFPPQAAALHLAPNPRAAFNKALKLLRREFRPRLEALGLRQSAGQGALSFPAPRDAGEIALEAEPPKDPDEPSSAELGAP